MPESFYALPRLSRRVWPVVQRNLLVWRKLALPSLLGNIAEPLIVLDISREPTLLLAVPLLVLVGITFASVALVFNALARNYDFFTYYFTLVLTPMTFLSGIYFPLEQLPQALRAVAMALPLTAAVEVVRPLVVGQWPADWGRPLAVLGLYAAGGYYVALALTRRRFFR